MPEYCTLIGCTTLDVNIFFFLWYAYFYFAVLALYNKIVSWTYYIIFCFPCCPRSTYLLRTTELVSVTLGATALLFSHVAILRIARLWLEVADADGPAAACV